MMSQNSSAPLTCLNQHHRMVVRVFGAPLEFGVCDDVGFEGEIVGERRLRESVERGREGVIDCAVPRLATAAFHFIQRSRNKSWGKITKHKNFQFPIFSRSRLFLT